MLVPKCRVNVSMSTGGEGGHCSEGRVERIDAKRSCAGGSAAETVPPPVCGSANLNEAMAVKHVGPGGKRASATGKWSLAGLLDGERGW